MKGIIRFNVEKQKYELMTKDQKIRLITSKNVQYLHDLINQQKHHKILKHKITDADVISKAPDFSFEKPTGKALAVPQLSEEFNIKERFAMTEELIGMVINKSAKSVLISGEGGVGKTHAVLKTLKAHGKVDVKDTMPNIEDYNPVEVSDDEEEMEDKVLSLINRPTGDYVVIKGYSSAKALFRTMFENRTKTIVFDDCDNVLKNENAVMLLKGALDSYEERWVTWNVESMIDTGLPSTFRFQGSIIFISNMDIRKVDAAVRTRCFKVDVSMTKEQRIEWMYNVLEDVMPDADMMDKLESINLLEKNMHKTKIDFRALMDIISIRVDPSVKDWKKLAKFTMMNSQ